jgi:hypothetical protein
MSKVSEPLGTNPRRFARRSPIRSLDRPQVVASEHRSVFLQTLIAFGAFAIVDALTRRAARLPGSASARNWLMGSVLRDRPTYAIAFLVLVAVFVRSGVGRSWRTLDRHREIRALAMVLVVWMTLRQVTANTDYVFGQLHAFDRIGLVALAVAVLRFPAAIPLFVLQYRVFEAPVRSMTDFVPGFNIDALALMAVLSVAAVVASAAARRTTSSTPLVSLLGSLVAAHFFSSGRGKVKLGWLAQNDLANLPLNGYAQGWLGAGGGQFARHFSDFLSQVNKPLLIATLVIELGAIVFIARRRLLMAALAVWLVFHIFLFAAMGFMFVDWAIVEIGLLALLVGAIGRTWSKPAFAKGPVVLAVLAVLGGRMLYDPPSLAWFDGPVAYRYELDGVDAQGRSWVVMPDDLAPYGQSFAFGMIGLGPTTPVTAGYGAWNGTNRSVLDTVSTIEELERFEAPLSAANNDERTIQVLTQFLSATCAPRSRLDSLPGSIGHFLLQRHGDRYDYRSPLVSLSIRRVTTLHAPSGDVVRDEPVRTLRAAPC